jgi:hypothetical protein
MSGIDRETKSNDEFMEYQILSPCEDAVQTV